MRTPHPTRTPMCVATLLVWLSLLVATGCSDSEAPASPRDAATELSGDTEPGDVADAREDDADVGPPDTDPGDVSGADVALDGGAAFGKGAERAAGRLSVNSTRA